MHFNTEIFDGICAGQFRSKDETETVFLFVRLTPEAGKFNKKLESRIRQAIARELSPRQVPKYIFGVKSIPFNANGKKLEIQLKRVLSFGEDGLKQLKLAEDEKAELAHFVQYFEIENLVSSQTRTQKL